LGSLPEGELGLPMSAQPQDLKVFISSRESTCDECGQGMGRSAWIRLLGERGAGRGLIMAQLRFARLYLAR